MILFLIHLGNLSLSSFDVDINCTSSISDSMRGIEIWCEFNTKIYNGFSAYLQNVRSAELVPATSNESGTSVIINSSLDGEHFVFVYPIWTPPGVMSASKMEPAHQKIYNLTGAMNATSLSRPIDISPIVGGLYNFFKYKNQDTYILLVCV